MPEGRIWFLLSFSGASLPNGHLFLHVAVLVYKLSPVHEGQKQTKKEAEHARLVGGNFNNQGNFPIRLVLGGCKMIRSHDLPSRVFKVDIEA